MSALARTIQGLVRRRDGVAAIEFAIALPVIVLVLMGLLEAGFLLAGGVLLDSGARAAARYGLTGAQRGGATREATIRGIVVGYVCPKAQTGGYCLWSRDTTRTDETGGQSPLLVTTEVYADPRNIGQPEPFTDTGPRNGTYDPGEAYTDVNGNGRWDPDQARSGSGGQNDIVVYAVSMLQDVMNPLFRAALGRSTIEHKSRVVIQNEAF